MYTQKKCTTFYGLGDKRMYVCKVTTDDDKEFFLTFKTFESKEHFIEFMIYKITRENGVFLNKDSVRVLRFYQEKEDKEFFLNFKIFESKADFMEIMESQIISEHGVLLNEDSVKSIHFY